MQDEIMIIKERKENQFVVGVEECERVVRKIMRFELTNSMGNY